MHSSQGNVWLIFNLGIKQRGLVIYTHNHSCYITELFHYRSAIIDSYMLERLRSHWYYGEWVCPDLCPKVDCFTLISAMWLGTLLRASHAAAWLSLLGLPRSNCRSKVPNLQRLYITQIKIPRIKRAVQQQHIYTNTYSRSVHIFMGELKRSACPEQLCRAQRNPPTSGSAAKRITLKNTESTNIFFFNLLKVTKIKPVLFAGLLTVSLFFFIFCIPAILTICFYNWFLKTLTH